MMEGVVKVSLPDATPKVPVASGVPGLGGFFWVSGVSGRDFGANVAGSRQNRMESWCGKATDGVFLWQRASGVT